MPLWTGEEFWAATGGALSGALPNAIEGISIDSRSLQKGDAFFALQGARDGHNFLADAAAKGAALLVIDKAHASLAAKTGAPCIIAADVMEALRALARAARARLKPQAKLAAITGSAGKTTVKEMLACILQQFGCVHSSPASFNNHLGVPLSLARMPRDTDYAVLEIGMSKAGEITPLAAMARPHLALITCIAAAHMGNFHNLEEIAAAKAEIFSGLEHNGTALLNRDDAHYGFLRQKLRESGHFVLFGFGRDKAAAYRLVSETAQPNGQKIGVSRNGDAKHEFTLNAAGKHMAENACAVLAAVSELVLRPQGDEWERHERIWNDGTKLEEKLAPYCEKIKGALAQFQPGAGRGARYRLSLPAGGAFTLIDESYNANPASMRAALKLLAAAEVQGGGRRIAVLGSMLELGAQAQAEHEKLAAEIIAAKADYVFLAGAEMRFLYDKLRQTAPTLPVCWQENAADLEPLLKKMLQNGDAVMLKGSNSVKLGAVAQDLKAAFQALP